jgi:hypothetical protein
MGAGGYEAAVQQILYRVLQNNAHYGVGSMNIGRFSMISSVVSCPDGMSNGDTTV